MFTYRAGIDTPFASDNIHLVKDFYQVKKGVSFGTFFTPIYAPALSSSFEGFDIIPRESNILVSAIKPGQSGYFRFLNNSWAATPVPVYQSIATVRDGLNRWDYQSIQFRIRLNEGAIFRELALGYNVPIDIFSYLINFRLPAILSQSFSFAVTAKTDGTGKVSLPEGFSNITNPVIKALSPTRSIIPHTISGRVLTTTSLNTAVLLEFDCTPSVQVINTDLLHQISALPEVLIKVKQETNIKQGIREDHLEILGNREIVESLDYSADQEIEIGVVARTNLESMAIARKLIGNIQSINKISSPADGLEYSLYVSGGIKEKPTINALSNSVMVSFNLKIFNYSVTSKNTRNYIA